MAAAAEQAGAADDGGGDDVDLHGGAEGRLRAVDPGDPERPPKATAKPISV
jgi:hypothetical protein